MRNPPGRGLSSSAPTGDCADSRQRLVALELRTLSASLFGTGVGFGLLHTGVGKELNALLQTAEDEEDEDAEPNRNQPLHGYHILPYGLTLESREPKYII